MKANYGQPASQVRLPRDAMSKFMLRSEVDAHLEKRIAEYEAKRKEELSAYASAVDATMLWMFHTKHRYGRKRLRDLWEDTIRTRIQARLYYREVTGYKEQATGQNTEDYAIHHLLRGIGVDLKAWENEAIIIDEETQEVRFEPRSEE